MGDYYPPFMRLNILMRKHFSHTKTPYYQCGVFDWMNVFCRNIVCRSPYRQTMLCSKNNVWSTYHERNLPVYITTFFHRNAVGNTVVSSTCGVINFIYIVRVVIDIFYWIFVLIDVKINRGGDCLSLVFRGGFYET